MRTARVLPASTCKSARADAKVVSGVCVKLVGISGRFDFMGTLTGPCK